MSKKFSVRDVGTTHIFFRPTDFSTSAVVLTAEVEMCFGSNNMCVSLTSLHGEIKDILLKRENVL